MIFHDNDKVVGVLKNYVPPYTSNSKDHQIYWTKMDHSLILPFSFFNPSRLAVWQLIRTMCSKSLELIMLQYNKAMKKSIRASHCNNNNNVKEWKEYDGVINSLIIFPRIVITHLWITVSWFSDKPKSRWIRRS